MRKPRRMNNIDSKVVDLLIWMSPLLFCFQGEEHSEGTAEIRKNQIREHKIVLVQNWCIRMQN